MAAGAPAGVVTGDWGLERYIYIEALPEEEANLREAADTGTIRVGLPVPAIPPS